MAFSRNSFDLRVGPLVRIGISAPGTPLSALPHKVATAWALIDTGAEISSILPAVAEEANPLSFEKRTMRSAHGTQPANIYLVDLQVHLDEIVSFVGCEVVEFPSFGNSRFRALLGRDILCRGSFSLENGFYELRF